MKVLYLFNSRARRNLMDRIKNGKDHDGSFYGMLRLKSHNIEASYIELESILPKFLATWIRKNVLNVYLAHIPFLFNFFFHDVVFSSSSFGSQLLRSLIPLRKPRWVMFDFSITGLMSTPNIIKRYLFYYIVNRSHGIITISEEEVSRLRTMFPKYKGLITFVHYGVDTNFFCPTYVKERHQIFSVGLDYGRDYKTLFNAVDGLGISVVTSKNNRAKGLDGKLPAYVQVKELNTDGVKNEYAISEIVVITLDCSGGGNDAMGISTLVEAMAMGKAIIITKTFTTESYIEDGVNGLLVPPKDSKALRVAIEMLMNDVQLRKKLGDQARIFAVEKCEADVFANKLADFFKKV